MTENPAFEVARAAVHRLAAELPAVYDYDRTPRYRPSWETAEYVVGFMADFALKACEERIRELEREVAGLRAERTEAMLALPELPLPEGAYGG